MKQVPEWIERWTADEVAECVSYQPHLTKPEADELYVKLWGFLENANNRTPQGGDGTNGTVEEPAARLGLDNDDKGGHWWHLLETKEQDAIVKGHASDCDELEFTAEQLETFQRHCDDRDMTGQDNCDGSTPLADKPTHQY